MTTQMENFATTFSPLFDSDKALAIALDILTISFGLLAAPALNSCKFSTTLKPSILFLSCAALNRQ